MQILIAEDEVLSRRILEHTLRKWGYDVVVTTNGREAWAILQQADPPSLAILDWMMPEMDGLEVCRKVRALARPEPTHLLLLTARDERDDVVAGIRAGADDYIVKPFHWEELHARVQAGLRIIGLQRSLAERVRELEQALAQVKQLHGLLPICSYCKKVRNDQNYWQQVEAYISARSTLQFSHGICPDCFEHVVRPQLQNQLGMSAKAIDAIAGR